MIDFRYHLVSIIAISLVVTSTVSTYLIQWDQPIAGAILKILSRGGIDIVVANIDGTAPRTLATQRAAAANCPADLWFAGTRVMMMTCAVGTPTRTRPARSP